MGVGAEGRMVSWMTVLVSTGAFIDVIQPGVDRSVRGDFPAEIRAHVCGVGVHAHAAEVEAIGIPAGADGGIGMMMDIGMPFACFQKQGEMVIGQMIELAPEALGEPGTA